MIWSVNGLSFQIQTEIEITDSDTILALKDSEEISEFVKSKIGCILKSGVCTKTNL